VCTKIQPNRFSRTGDPKRPRSQNVSTLKKKLLVADDGDDDDGDDDVV